MAKELDITSNNNQTVPTGAEFFAISQIFQQTKQDLVFVARNNKRSKEIYDSLKYFQGTGILHFPSWDTEPYDLLSPSLEILHTRISTLNELAYSHHKKIIVTSYESVVQKIIPKEFLTQHSISLEVGQMIAREQILQFLIDNGYTKTTTASDAGEFAVRGSIIDIYASGYKYGHRVDFFGNQIEQIKTFDPITQITKEHRHSFKIIPHSEIILNDKIIQNFKDKLVAKYGTKAMGANIISKLDNNVKPIGIEQWYSLFYPHLDNICDYFPEANFIFDFMALNNLENYLETIEEKYQQRKLALEHHDGNFTLPPNELYLTKDELQEKLNSKTVVFNEDTYSTTLKALPNLELFAKTKKITTFQYIANYIESKKPLIISAVSEGGKERIKKILEDHDIHISETKFTATNENFNTGICVAPFIHGFESPQFILITENDIFGERVKSVKIRKNRQIKNLIEQAYNYTPGELVVHKEHGIGRFTGLETLDINGIKHDCLKIIYHGDDKLFLPVENIDLISKYGLEGNVQLDKLGSASWQARKAKIKQRLKISAEQLVKTAAERAVEKAPILETKDGLFEEFCAGFPHIETEDQLNAIHEVIEDLKSGKPMDRLICGDVGFGKTEVAMRAAFIAAKADSSKKYQVAIFCPTTLLCRQHYQVFKQRLEKFGIKVAQISRLVSDSKKATTIEEINNGKVDVIIGTHALLNKKIKFHNLALLIIDEEQHFGVIQKEKLKELKSNLHVLTMSATPIPRTLQMSLSGIKELSLIATPPVNRLVTKTSVLTYDPVIIKEALMREYYRGGQSFYVCPRISDLKDVEAELKELVPDLKYIIAHGQMPPSSLDEIMNNFYDGKYDILLCTTIIESGLDIPKANTLIVHKSQKFGLSQLYQIRGRVGRSNISAYAYFTLDAKRKLQDNVITRLDILQHIDNLGAGFSIATHDMDTRGFGNLLGDEQSGHIKEVGIELYQDLLQEEIRKLQSKETTKASESELSPQINLGLTTLIPETYISDADVRLNLYRRVGSITDNIEIEEFAAEMVDRFGPIPAEFENLLSLIKLKNLSKKVGIIKIEAGPKAILLRLNEKHLSHPEKLLDFVFKHPREIKVRSNNEILLLNNPSKAQSSYKRITGFLEQLLTMQ